MSVAGPEAQAGWRRNVRILEWLPGYQRGWLRFDVIAALTVWAVVVPQAIAYAQIAGLSPATGLAAAAAALTGYALLGTSRQLIANPTSSTAALSASLVVVIAAGDATRVPELSSALALVVGITFVVFGLLRLGFIARFIPTAVQIGFLFGLGLTIMVGQLAKVLGVPATSGTFVDQAIALLGGLGAADAWTVAIGVGSLAILLVARQLSPALPAALLVVIVSIVLVNMLGLDAEGVATLGVVTGGLPVPALPSVSGMELLSLVPGAVAVAIVAFAEFLTVAQRLGDEHRQEISPDRELIGNGGANLLSGLFQGFVVGGGASQSAAADRAGGRTPLVSLLVAALVVATSVALLPLFADLPQAALGAIVIAAVVGFLRVDEVRRLARLRRDSLVGAVVALAATLVLGILPGLMLAVGAALVYLLVGLARPTVEPLGRDAHGGSWVALERHADAIPLADVLVMRLEAPLLFLNAGLLRDQVRARLREADPPARLVILDLSMTADLDVESLDILVRLGEHVREAGAELWLAEVRGPVHAIIARAGLDGGAAPFREFHSMADAVAAAQDLVGGRS